MDMKRKDNPIAGVLSRLTLILAIFPTLFGVIVLIGWIANSLQIARISARFIPMAPSTALCFTLLGAALLCRRWQSHNRSIRSVWQALTGIVLLFNIAIFIQFALVFVTDLSLDIERWFAPASLYEQGFVIGRMSPLTALLFILFSSAILLSPPFAAMQAARDRVAQSFVMAVLILAGILAVGYWYGTPLLYGGTLTPVALTTDIGFILLSSGFLFEGSNSLLTRWMMSTSVFDRFTRLVLPGLIGINLLVGWVHLTILAQLPPVYGVLSFSLSALFSAGLVTFLTIVVARQVQAEVTQAGQALVRSHDLLNLTGQMAKVGGWELDVESQTLSWTEEVYRIHEVDPATHLDVAEAINFYAPQAQPLIRAAVQVGIDSGTPWDLELPLITAKGRHIWVRAQGAAERCDGRTVRLYGAFQDITVRKQAEEALQESEKRYREVVENASDIIYSTNRNGRFEYANAAALRATGCSYEELTNLSYLDLILPAYHNRVKTKYFRQFLGKQPSSYVEFPFFTRSGEVRWFGQNSSLILKGQHVAGFHVIARDITERKQAEAEIRALNASLEGRVTLRTAELETANRELRQAKDAAEQAHRAKSEFLSRMSHELRTPLNAILGFTEVLEVSKLEPRQQANLRHIHTAGRHLLDLINEVLDIAKVEGGQLNISLEAVILSDLVSETLDLIQPLAEQRGIQITPLQITGQAVQADRQRLRQVLLNLLANAIKYNHEGGTVMLTCEPRPDNHLRINVSDKGPGIPADMLGRIFSPFDRLGAEKNGVEGTGLGLALSKQLIEAMGGAIGVESRIGQGSVFWLELPESSELVDQGKHSGILIPSFQEQKTLLYAEDNQSSIELIEQILLMRPAVKLITTKQGHTCIDLSREQHPDLILLDINLPDMHGMEVLKVLQKEARTQAIPVVVISADATPHRIERLLESGARAYLTKPMDVRQFLETLDRILH